MYYFIINPHSKTGHALSTWNELKKILRIEQVTYQYYITKKPRDATRFVGLICKKDQEEKKIIIVGGDGTANEVINGLYNYPSITLGYIPVGSGNDLARGLGLPKDPKKALELILHPKCYRYIDHGITCFSGNTNSKRFGISCGIGYDASICKEALTSPLKTVLNHLHLGKLIYILVAFLQVFTHKREEAKILIDKKERIHTKKLIFMAALIHKYEGGGLLMAPTAKSDDQMLEVCLVSDLSRLRLLLLMPTIFFGIHTKFPGIRMISCHSIEVITSHPMTVHTDGEIMGESSHITISCLKEQIRMFSL